RVALTRSGITFCRKISFESRLSDRKSPSGSDSSEIRLQYSRSDSRSGSEPTNDDVARIASCVRPVTESDRLATIRKIARRLVINPGLHGKHGKHGNTETRSID